MRSILRALVVLLLLRSDAGHSQSVDSVVPDAGSGVVTTRHTIAVKGTPLAYTARAGFIPILDEATGEVHAKIFFVSYTAEPHSGQPPRPLTFFTMGGPVEPATLSDIGPRLLKGDSADGPSPPPPYEMVDNQETWLATTDLVLIDPVGTGYSRATKLEYATQYYNPDGDAESIAQTMQLYLKLYEPTTRRPIFVAGVSYGSIRTALIADIAIRRAIPLRGLILASSALAEQPYRDVFHRTDRSYIQWLPTFTATAFFHKKLPPDLQRNFDQALGQAEAWAADAFPKLLAQADALSSEQLGAAAAQMARLTGLSPDVIREHKFRFLPDDFLRELLGADWSVLGLGDSRKTKADDGAGEGNALTAFEIPSSLYLKGELQFQSEVPYDSGVFTLIKGWHCAPSNHNCVDPQALVRLQHAMRANPSLRVMITTGYYDLVCPYFGSKWAISQIAPALRARVNIVYYQAGHHVPPEHRAAVSRFIEGASAISGNINGVRAQGSQ
jgi:carboxypeptidase C (cathepsin A)